MVEPIREGEALIFMKVGTHASELLEDIIRRKRKEIADAGFSLWGYGGNTCFPTTVQAFATAAAGPIRLCMQPMTSKHVADRVRADYFSVDRIQWDPIPEPINVIGSRFALCIRSLEDADLSLPLPATRVAVGRSKGRPGDAYLQGHVDKACLEVVEPPGDDGVPIGLVAELADPYAVFLKN